MYFIIKLRPMLNCWGILFDTKNETASIIIPKTTDTISVVRLLINIFCQQPNKFFSPKGLFLVQKRILLYVFRIYITNLPERALLGGK